MSAVSAIIPATPFLQSRVGGMSGIARSVILADLVGASLIWIVGEWDEPRDWIASFSARKRPLPKVLCLRDMSQIPVPADTEQRMIFPGDILLTPEGVAALARGDLANLAHYSGTDPETLTFSILRSTIKPSDGWVSRHINRPISMRISALFLSTGIGPVPVTWLTLALAFVMVAILAQGTATGIVLGGLLFQAVSIIDGVDGELARSTYRFSARGALLDTICDMIANLGFAIGLIVGLSGVYGIDYIQYAIAIVILFGTGVSLMLMLLRVGSRKWSFDVLRAALTHRLQPWPMLQTAVLAIERLFKRDAYALFGCLTCAAGIAWILPPIIVGGLMIWILAIAWCAPLIARDKLGGFLPPHLRT